VARGRKIVLAAGAVVLAVASPLAYTLAPVGVGNVVSASVIAGTAAAALAVTLWSGRAGDPEPGDNAAGDGAAVSTGRARATSGGQANTGVRRRDVAEAGWAERTGDATARGLGSRANTGVEGAD
jgi:hypothetical protein